VVTNTGNVPETFEFNATTATAATPWALAASTATDRFTLAVIANPSAPITTDFGSEDKILNNLNLRCSSTIATNGSSTCIDVAPGTSRTIWFKLGMPGLTTTGAAQQILINGIATVPD
jgi:hypothetical protein